MKKIISAILLITILLSFSSSAYATGKLLSTEEGKSALADELDMTLEYVKLQGENRAVLLYTPNIGYFEDFAVSAETGKRVKIPSAGGGGGPSWPPEQRREVNENEVESNGLLGEDEIVVIVKGMKETVFCDYSVDSVSYIYSGRDEHGYFYKAEVKLSDGENSATVILNAKNGDAESFSSKLIKGDEKETNTEKLFSDAEEFIEKRTGIPIENLTAEMRSETTFNFSRTEKGFVYGRDRIYITFDKTTGKISSMSKYWNPDVVFEDMADMISEDAAKKAFVEFAKPELQQRTIADGTEISVYILTRSALSGIGIGAKNGSPLCVRTDGEVYRPDLWGHWAEEKIMELSKRRIISWDGEFRPDEPISEAEAAEFLDASSTASGGEKAVSTAISRQAAVAYIIDVLGIDEETESEVGKIKFLDKADLLPQYYDSVARASRLGIVSGYGDGTFRPGRLITRAEFATMLYNVLVK